MSEDIMNCVTVTITRHAMARIGERLLDVEDVEAVARTGEIIIRYHDDRPHPSVLRIGMCGGQPLHALVAMNALAGECIVVTAYVPDDALWEPGYRARKP